ncbi:MAG: zf-HC2 domain-containing protein [Bacteroidota bacterium]|nr:zf-HC2 domain-containing protein [Bacteroidota bacterium]
MKCNKIHKYFYRYHLGELSPPLKDEIENHITNCTECSALYTKLVQTLNHLNDRETLPEQPFYYTRLKQRMENKKEQTESVWSSGLAKKILQPVIYMASLILAVYIGILIGSGTGSYESNLAKNEALEDDYIEAFVEYQYLNDFQIESIENVFLSEEEKDNKEF